MSEDYSFMKSGFTNEINQKFDFEKQVTELITMYTYNALNSAAIYIEHAGRNKITPEDIKRALMLEIFLFTNRDIDKDIIDFKNKLYENMVNNNDNEEENSDHEDEDDGEIDKFCESECECAMCKCLNKIYTRWENFTPNSRVEEILRDRINEM